MANRTGKTCKLAIPLNTEEAQATFIVIEDNGGRLHIEVINNWHYQELVAEEDIIIEEGDHGTVDGKI